jgi:hypothetical protein
VGSLLRVHGRLKSRASPMPLPLASWLCTMALEELDELAWWVYGTGVMLCPQRSESLKGRGLIYSIGGKPQCCHMGGESAAFTPFQHAVSNNADRRKAFAWSQCAMAGHDMT